MNNLYVVESPLQALCALEVSLGKNNEKHFIIAHLPNNTRNQNNQQILKILELRSWNHKIIFKSSSSENKIINQILKLKQLSEINKKFANNIDSLYIGEFRYQFMHMIRSIVDAPKVYLLDDGAATVKIINDYIKKYEYHPDIDLLLPNSFIERNIFKILYAKYFNIEVLEKKLKVITAFAKADSEFGIEELKFHNLKSVYNVQKFIDNETVYFYGSKYSEAGIISLDYELEFLSLIKNYYDSKDMNIFYFSHRDESEEKLNILTNELNFTVKKSDDIAELYLLNSSVLPKEVAGAYTSTLNNIKSLFSVINVTSFKLHENKINSEFIESVDNVYQYYSDEGINIISFDK
ncbi:hypothetical protein [Psychrobacter sanguinis]|uniref:hypothetical protein n=1 Tax=Psychrobacter sanguinis TaxID=861445 RepID=UPI00191A4105|nr:hypothetical protein [Psychrobacter sanguinis]MCD9150526.1 alpha-2,8-polysialyltransferase family protein [Psychrobacter sanguinis]